MHRTRKLFLSAIQRQRPQKEQLRLSPLALRVCQQLWKPKSGVERISIDIEQELAPGDLPEIAKALISNDSLRFLSLYNQDIQKPGSVALARALAVHPKLKKIFLSTTPLGLEDIKALSLGIALNTTLDSLSLSRNDMSDEHVEILSRSLLNSLEDSSLKFLTLTKNGFGDEGAKAIAQVLSHLRLRRLKIAENKIANDGVKIIAEAMIKTDSVRMLDLSHNEIGDDGAVALGEALKKTTCLESLQLHCNKFGQDGSAGVGRGLEENKSVEFLTLSGNQIGLDGANAIANALQCGAHSLRALNLVETGIGDAEVELLAGGIGAGSKAPLKRLNLSNNSIGPDGTRSLSKVLQGSSSQLDNLDLRNNQVGAEGSRILAQALQDNSGLRRLNLEGNKLGDDAAQELAQLLRSDRPITHLSLDANEIGDDGVCAIADALATNHHLQALYLRGNKIGNLGIEALANALRSENSALRYLSIGENNITAEGAITLADALAVNTSVRTLSLPYNRIGDEGANAIARGLKSNHSLKELDLEYNLIGEEGAKALLETEHSGPGPSMIVLYDSGIPKTLKSKLIGKKQSQAGFQKEITTDAISKKGVLHKDADLDKQKAAKAIEVCEKHTGREHEKTLDERKELAAASEISVDSERIEPEKRQWIEDLQTLAGNSFWTTKLRMSDGYFQVVDSVLPFFERDKTITTKKGLLPHIKAHLELVQKIAKGTEANSLSEVDLSNLGYIDRLALFVLVDKQSSLDEIRASKSPKAKRKLQRASSNSLSRAENETMSDDETGSEDEQGNDDSAPNDEEGDI